MMTTSKHLSRGMVAIEAIRAGARTTKQVAAALIESKTYYGNDLGAYATARAIVRTAIARGRVVLTADGLRVKESKQ